MTDADILDLVAKMRNAQKIYFKERSSLDLQRSKELERQVDAALAKRKQGELL